MMNLSATEYCWGLHKIKRAEDLEVSDDYRVYRIEGTDQFVKLFWNGEEMVVADVNNMPAWTFYWIPNIADAWVKEYYSIRGSK